MGEGYRAFACQKSAPMNFTIPDTPVMGLWKIVQPLIKDSK